MQSEATHRSGSLASGSRSGGAPQEMTRVSSRAEGLPRVGGGGTGSGTVPSFLPGNLAVPRAGAGAIGCGPEASP